MEFLDVDSVRKLRQHKNENLKDLLKNPETRDKQIVLALQTLGKFDF
jgi:hypothetical protein